MDIIKLNQIEELLNTLIAIIQKGFKKNRGTIYQFTPATICSVYENIKKATSKRKSSFSCLFQKFILK